MPEIEPVNYESAEGEAKELLDEVQARLGATPNMTTTMARSAVLAGWLGLGGALSKGAVGGADAERIALGVAEANECAYCLSAQRAPARRRSPARGSRRACCAARSPAARRATARCRSPPSL